MSLQTWIANLSNANESERMYAAEDMGYSNDSECITPLVSHLRTEQSRAVKETIFSALARINHDDVIRQAVSLFESDDAYLRNQASALLARRGKPALSHLLRAMANPDPNVRKLALDTIGQIRAPETQDIFDAALSDADMNIVITSVEHIGVCRCRALKSRIEKMLDRASEPMLATALLETLCAIGDEDSLNLALRRFAPVEQAPEFLLYSLIKLVSEQGVPDHTELLCSLLNARGPHIYQQILDALTRIRERYPKAPPSASVLAALEKHMNQNQTDLQCNQTLTLLRPFSLVPEVAPVWRKALALQRLKRPELCRSLEISRGSKE